MSREPAGPPVSANYGDAPMSGEPTTEPDEATESGPAAAAGTPGYAAAMAELEAILGRLEDDRLDIDLLADHVARAAELVALCRERLDVARLRVNEIVADLDDMS